MRGQRGVIPNRGSESTTSSWRYTKIRQAPRRQQQSPSEARPFRSLPWRDPRLPLTIKVSYRGGPEAWIEIHARGAVMRVRGSEALFDVLRWVWQWDQKPKRR